jgi:hypothetical protein
MRTSWCGTAAALALLATAPAALAQWPGVPAEFFPASSDSWAAVQHVVDAAEAEQLQRVLAPAQWIALPLARHAKHGRFGRARNPKPTAHWQPRLAEGRRH